MYSHCYRFCGDNRNTMEPEYAGFVLKKPYTTNQKYGRLKSIEDIVCRLNSLRDKFVGVIPYVMLQAYLHNTVEYKVVCFNGKALYEASIDNCSRVGGTKKGFASKEERFIFAESVISKLKTVCPSAELSSLVRVDIFWCDYLHKMVLNEFESLEARIDANANDLNKQFFLERLLSIYHANRLISFIGKHINQELESIEYPIWPW